MVRHDTFVTHVIQIDGNTTEDIFSEVGIVEERNDGRSSRLSLDTHLPSYTTCATVNGILRTFIQFFTFLFSPASTGSHGDHVRYWSIGALESRYV